MPKNRRIIWSPRAENDFANVLDYLNNIWGKKVANEFIDTLDNKISFIANTPNIYPEYDKKRKIRYCVINKHNTLYYSVNQNSIELLTIYPTAQDPKKLHTILHT